MFNSDIGMNKSIRFLLFAFFLLSTNNVLANPELWGHAADQDWSSVFVHLMASPTAREDLEFVHEGFSVRDILIDSRKAIKEQNRLLYGTLFSETGIIPWFSDVESEAIENLVVASRAKEEIALYAPESVRDELLRQYRELLANKFSAQELAALALIYEDPFHRRLPLIKPGFQTTFSNLRDPIDDERAGLFISLAKASGIDIEKTYKKGLVYIFRPALEGISNYWLSGLVEVMNRPVYRRERLSRVTLFSSFT